MEYGRRAARAAVAVDIQRNYASPEALSRAESFDFELLDLVAREPRLTQRAIAAQLGISVGRANAHVRRLREDGELALEKSSGERLRPAYAYRLTPRGEARRERLARSFLARKRTEYDRLGERIDALARELDKSEGDFR